MAQCVTVLCRLPSGVTLKLYDLDQLTQRATSETPIMQPAAPRRSVTLNGAKHDPRYHPAEGRLLGRAGRTQVDGEFWEAWRAQNTHNALLTDKLVFAEASPAKADSAMAEMSREKTGLEGNDPDNLPAEVGKMEKE